MMMPKTASQTDLHTVADTSLPLLCCMLPIGGAPQQYSTDQDSSEAAVQSDNDRIDFIQSQLDDSYQDELAEGLE